MLQYQTQPADRYSIPEQCQMAIEGGCAWIQLHLPDADDSQVRELCSELIPLCRESSTILMLEDRPELAKELGLHGVHITADSGLSAARVREDFGPEAIVGVEVGEPASILALKGADIDYATLRMSLDRAARVIAAARDGGSPMPIVYGGAISLVDIPAVMAAGASGVLVGADIARSADPVRRTEEFLDSLRANTMK